DRGAPPEELLDDDEAVDRRAVVPAVRGGQGHAEPTALAELARERRVLGGVHPEAGLEGAARQLPLEELDDLVPELQLVVGELDRCELDHVAGARRPWEPGPGIRPAR